MTYYGGVQRFMGVGGLPLAHLAGLRQRLNHVEYGTVLVTAWNEFCQSFITSGRGETQINLKVTKMRTE